MKRHNKRRQYSIVDRSLQYKLLAMIFIYGFIIAVFLAGFLFLPDIIHFKDGGFHLELLPDAADRILALHSRIWPAIIALVWLLAIHSFRAFHRLIGPLFRFRWAFGQLRNGTLNFRVKIRNKDYLHREEEEFNEMIEVLAGKLENIQIASQDSLKSFGALEQKLNGSIDWNEGDKGLLNVHRQNLRKLVDAVRYFRIHEVNEGHNGAVTA